MILINTGNGKGKTTGEYTYKFLDSCLIPPTPFLQFENRLVNLGKSEKVTLRTPVFSTNSTRFPLSARVSIISWCPCQIKSQSMDEKQIIFCPFNISALTLLDKLLHIMLLLRSQSHLKQKDKNYAL